MEEIEIKNEDKKQIKMSLKTAIIIIIGILAIILGIIYYASSKQVITEQGKNCTTNTYISYKVPTCNDIQYDSIIGHMNSDVEDFIRDNEIVLDNALITTKEEFDNYFEIFLKAKKVNKGNMEFFIIDNNSLPQKQYHLELWVYGERDYVSIADILKTFDEEYFVEHNLAVNVGPYDFVSVNIQNGNETINFKEEQVRGSLAQPKYFNFITLNKDVEKVNFDIYTQKESIMEGLAEYKYFIISVVYIILIIIVAKILHKSKNKIAKILMIIIMSVILLRICWYLLIVYLSATSIDKPIIYLYPEQETNVEVTLGNPEKITCSYPKYIDSWNVLAKPNGDLIELDTNRNLYALYYESESLVDFKIEEGFCVKGEDSSKFLEEKLEILGLNEREAEEFIIYWLPKLESNNYNYIRFATAEEINKNMPLEINPKPDTTIRVLMIFKGLDKEIPVVEQTLEKQERNGFVAVEWGGTEIK